MFNFTEIPLSQDFFMEMDFFSLSYPLFLVTYLLSNQLDHVHRCLLSPTHYPLKATSDTQSLLYQFKFLQDDYW